MFGPWVQKDLKAAYRALVTASASMHLECAPMKRANGFALRAPEALARIHRARRALAEALDIAGIIPTKEGD